MRIAIKKWFWAWDFDKEEKWLNEMSAKGLPLVAVSFCNYIFEDCTPGEFTYRIELLNNWPTHFESQQYIRFIEETGAEHIGSVMRWVYFRKKTAQGNFDLYSDFDSRIKHLNRLLTLLGVIACANIPNSLNCFGMGITEDSPFLLVCSVLILCMSGLIGFGFLKIWKKKRQLQTEKNLFE